MHRWLKVCLASCFALVLPPLTPAAEPAAAPSAPWSDLFFEQGPQWTAPTQHVPLDLEQIPSGVGCLVVVRPAELFALAEGEKLRTAEPVASLIRRMDASLQAVAHVPLADVEQLILAVASDPQMGYQASLVVRLKKADHARLTQQWSRGETWTHEGATYYAEKDRLCFIPAAKAGKQFAVALGVTDRAAIARELAGLQRGLFRRELESLLEKADGARHLTVAFNPSFLLGQGKSLLSGPLAPVLDELKTLATVDDRSRELAKAMMVSLHAGEACFHVECRVEAGNAVPPALAAHALYERLTALPGRVRLHFEAHAATLGATAGRAILARYPLMLNVLAGYLRSGVQGRQAVLTSVLPPEAAHNLALATTWAFGVDTSATPAAAPAALTFAQRLAQRGNFKVPSDSFDRIVDLLRGQTGLEIELLGGDLQIEGITKGKRVTLDLPDASAAEVLTELARLCNPALVDKVDSPQQKLVWVIDDSRGPGKERIVYTTRDKAPQRGKLPPAFMAGQRR